MSEILTINLDTAQFAELVEKAMVTTVSATDAEGRRIAFRPTMYRMAVEIRQAIRNATGCQAEVRDWDTLVAVQKPPFPGIVHRPSGDDDSKL